MQVKAGTIIMCIGLLIDIKRQDRLWLCTDTLHCSLSFLYPAMYQISRIVTLSHLFLSSQSASRWH